jgi:hypothetical protein
MTNGPARQEAIEVKEILQEMGQYLTRLLRPSSGQYRSHLGVSMVAFRHTSDVGFAGFTFNGWWVWFA